LTDASVRALPSPAKGIALHFDDLLPGFAVRCSQGGAKAFVLTYGPRTARRRITIGRYPMIGLSDARNAAKRLLAEHTLGRHHAPRMTYAAAVETFLADKAQHNRARTMRDTKRILETYFASVKSKSLEDITTHELTRITDKLAKDTPGTARHAFSEARAFFRWCVQRRYIPHSPLEGLKPVPARTRDRVLSDDELRAVWRAADAMEGHSGIVVKLLILTGQRRGEISALRGEWITGVTETEANSNYVSSESTACGVAQLVEHSAVNRVVAGSSPAAAAICLPSSITKNKRSHTFPIGSLTLATLPSTSGLLFPARGSTDTPFNGWSKAKAQLDKKVCSLLAENGQATAAHVQPWTLHDLRRTYATNLQRLGTRLEIIEALLNHVSGTRAGIVGVYQRHRYEAEMREAGEAYERWFSETILLTSPP
jgi:integrase